VTPRQIGLATLATLLLAGASTVAVAAADQAGPDRVRMFAGAGGTTCAVPALSGSVVDVSLIDMNGMGAMMGYGGNRTGTWHPTMMRIALTSGKVAAGQVSLRVTNLGGVPHELIVLPLGPEQTTGTRIVGIDGTVDATGSLAEVSAICAAGAGDGLAPGSTGWTTLQLSTGRYELVCNFPGHYAAGMYTELDVT